MVNKLHNHYCLWNIALQVSKTTGHVNWLLRIIIYLDYYFYQTYTLIMLLVLNECRNLLLYLQNYGYIFVLDTCIRICYMQFNLYVTHVGCSFQRPRLTKVINTQPTRVDVYLPISVLQSPLRLSVMNALSYIRHVNTITTIL